ncbi:hypothetical protein F4780DRAFT_725507 [Xylariomycetidae sp. FL0641]|nr:hypothetical protein F4780DRAFT_725507 [Xylariomycetidae sp. FL0641]
MLTRSRLDCQACLDNMCPSERDINMDIASSIAIWDQQQQHRRWEATRHTSTSKTVALPCVRVPSWHLNLPPKISSSLSTPLHHAEAEVRQPPSTEPCLHLLPRHHSRTQPGARPAPRRRRVLRRRHRLSDSAPQHLREPRSRRSRESTPRCRESEHPPVPPAPQYRLPPAEYLQRRRRRPRGRVRHQPAPVQQLPGPGGQH